MKTPDTTEEVLEQIGIKVAAVGEFEISAKCPFHADNHPSFSINAKTGLWICYQCSRAGTLQMLVQEIGGPDTNPVEFLREVKHKTIRRRADPHPVVEKEENLNPYVVYARYENFGRVPSWALDERYISREACVLYGVKWARGWILPIWSADIRANDISRLMGWQFKQLDYVSNFPKQVKKSQTLFGLRELALGTKGVVVVESPLDAVRLASVEIPAVSTYGAFVSSAQIQLLITTFDRIVLALDNDTEGRAQTAKIYPRLARLVPTTKAVLPSGAKDPGDLTDKQALRVFDDVSGDFVRLSKRSKRDDARSRVSLAGAPHGPGEDRHIDRSP